MTMLEKAARAIARTTLSDKGKEVFDKDPAYYKREFSAGEREDFIECAAAAIEAIYGPPPKRRNRVHR